MSRVAVRPKILRWARERVGKDLEELQARFPRILEWETEEVRPTLKQLEKYAKGDAHPVRVFLSRGASRRETADTPLSDSDDCRASTTEP